MANHFATPICFFDLETTGISTSTDRVVEIAIVRLENDGRRTEFHSVVNPTVPIPAGATRVHGITDAIAATAPTFQELAPAIADFIGTSAIGGFNCLYFDVPLLCEEFARAGYEWNLGSRHCVDVMRIYHRHHTYTKETPRRLGDAVVQYLGKPLEDAHSALADTRATLDVLLQQITAHDLSNDLGQLCSTYHSQLGGPDVHGKVRIDIAGRLVFNFGRWQNEPVSDHPDYVDWMATADFPASTIGLLRAHLAAEASL